MQRQDLERMTREQLIEQAERLNIPRPRVLTQPELIDEIIWRTAKDERERAKARGWLGRARDLLASVVERGLHMPEAARVLRQQGDQRGFRPPPPPLPTVTLAEIYAAQGHFERAVAVLDEVIAREPEHREAHAMRVRFAEQAQRSRARGVREKEPAEAEPVDEEAADTSEAPASEHPVAVGGAPPHAPAQAEPAAAPAPAARTQAPAPSDPGGPSDARVTAGGERGHLPVPAAAPEGVLAPSPVASAPAPLVEPPLPDRYEVDEIVAISV